MGLVGRACVMQEEGNVVVHEQSAARTYVPIRLELEFDGGWIYSGICTFPYRASSSDYPLLHFHIDQLVTPSRPCSPLLRHTTPQPFRSAASAHHALLCSARPRLHRHLRDLHRLTGLQKQHNVLLHPLV